MKYFVQTLLITGLIVASCSGKETTEDSEGTETTQTEQKEVISDNEIDGLMFEIDSKLVDMPLIRSLRYAKENQTSVDVSAWLDANNQIVKIEEFLLDGPTGIQTRKHFYSNGGTLYATKIVQEKRPEGKDPYYSELITFYNDKGEATSSKERTARYEELLEQESFSKVTTTPLSSENAMMVLNQQGPYETTFQGFVESGPYSFLIVGENAADGYTSSLSIQEPPSPTINYLRQQGKKALGQKLLVNFERLYDAQGYEMQVLMDVALVQEKEKEKKK